MHFILFCSSCPFSRFIMTHAIEAINTWNGNANWLKGRLQLTLKIPLYAMITLRRKVCNKNCGHCPQLEYRNISDMLDSCDVSDLQERRCRCWLHSCHLPPASCHWSTNEAPHVARAMQFQLGFCSDLDIKKWRRSMDMEHCHGYGYGHDHGESMKNVDNASLRFVSFVRQIMRCRFADRCRWYKYS